MTRAAKEAVSGAARNGPHAGACSSAEWVQPTVDLEHEGRRVRGRFGSTNPRSVPGNRGYWGFDSVRSTMHSQVLCSAKRGNAW